MFFFKPVTRTFNENVPGTFELQYTSPKSDSSGLRYSVRVTRKSDLAKVRQHQRQPTIANPKRSRMVIKSITVLYIMTNASKGSMATFVLCE